MELIYKNTEGVTVSMGQVAPFVVTSKDGFGNIQNEITSIKQAGINGEIFVSQRLAVRELEIEGEIIATSMEELTTFRRQLSSIFNPFLAGMLTYNSDDGNTYEIDVLPEMAPSFESTQKNLTLGYSLSLKALEPFWRDLSDYGKLIVISDQENKLTFPLQITQDFTFASLVKNSIKEIVNNGDIAVGAIFTLKLSAAVAMPEIYNVITQESFKFSGTFAAGTTIILDTRAGHKRAVQILDGVEKNIMAYKIEGSTFLQFQKGSNFITLKAMSGIEYMSGQIEFTPLVLGV
ncbi:MAG: phage tail domain-containing protein [Lactococcus petauri]